MLNIIIIISIILILILALTTHRITTLTDIVKRDKNKSHVPKGNNLQGVLFFVFMVLGFIGFFVFSIWDFDTYNLPIASEHGVITEKIFWITMAITISAFVITHIFLFGFSFKYRYKKDYKAKYYPHNNQLEIIWTLVPAIVLSWLIISGLKQWNIITGPAPENAEVIEVMGYQYAWAFRYPGKDRKLGTYDFRKIDAINSMGINLEDQTGHDDFIPTQLVIPKNKPVLLKIRGRDVIHSVFNPHFRMQMNAVPGMITQFWFTPTVSTAEMRKITGKDYFNYELVCNKICGKNHYGMKGIIVVLEQEEYDEWYKKNQENTFLKLNPSYINQVPEELQEAAKIVSGIENIDNKQKMTPKAGSFN